MRWQSLLLAEKVPNMVRRMRWKGYVFPGTFGSAVHSIRYLRSRGARGGKTRS